MGPWDILGFVLKSSEDFLSALGDHILGRFPEIQSGWMKEIASRTKDYDPKEMGVERITKEARMFVLLKASRTDGKRVRRSDIFYRLICSSYNGILFMYLDMNDY